MRKILFLIFLLAFNAAGTGMLAQTRKWIDVQHYIFDLRLNDSTNIIEGKAVITLKNNPAESVVLDLRNVDDSGKGMRVRDILSNGESVRWEHSGNLVRIDTGSKAGSDSVVSFTVLYLGIPADGLIISKNKFGNRTFFADHWPDRASNYLPVNDVPYDKATVEFIISAPSRYKVVGSGYLVEESDMPDGTRLTHWKEDVPIATKVMTFGAASFAVKLVGNVDGIPVWTWVYPENRLEGFNDYSIAVRPLAFYTGLLGPFSYEKLADVQSKTIFGGLENAGCIFYSENSVTGKGRAEGLIAHEIAHQWFGDSVTEKEWHHIWLSEGFATYLASVYTEKTYGKDRLDEDMRSARNRVLRFYDRNPSPVIDTTVTDLMRLLNDNSYRKGAWILHMLRSEIGDDTFWSGLRLYYSRYRNGNADSEDFKRVMEEVSGKDLGNFFHQWLYVPGQPELRINWTDSRKKGIKEIQIEQTQNDLYVFNLEVGIKDETGYRKVVIPVSQRITKYSTGAGKDAEMTIDPDVMLLFRLNRND